MKSVRSGGPVLFTRLVLAFYLVLCLAAPRWGAAANFALLVGVSDYEESADLFDLRGPANDIALMQDVLAARGYKIMSLSDGAPDGGRATRQSILKALEDLSDRVTQGDHVYLHFSGLGTLQSNADGDGLEAVLLPSDAARPEVGTSVIPNALTGSDLGPPIAAMRAQGVDVWVVLDTCHAIPVLKVGSARTAARCVNPGTLGIEGSGVISGFATDVEGADGLAGRYLVFAAAEPGALAHEVQLAETDPSSWYGLLTSRIAAVLETGHGGSYHALFEDAAEAMADEVLPGAARLQQPQWQGNLIDAAVPGMAEADRPHQFPVLGDELQAGKLHGLRDYAVVALLGNAKAGTDDILGYAQLHQTSARKVRLFGLTGPCAPRVEAPCTGIGAVPEGAVFARLVALPFDATTRIAPPVDLTTGELLDPSDPFYMTLAQATLGSSAEDSMAIRLDPNAAILSGVYDGALWFGERLSAGATPMGLRWHPDDGPIALVLRRIAQGEEVAEVLTNLSGTRAGPYPSPVDLRITQRVADADKLAPEGSADPAAECAAAQNGAEVRSDLPLFTQVTQCDTLEFDVRGKAPGPALDVNRIHIDSQFCVSTRHQRIEDLNQSVMVGDPMTFCTECQAGGTTPIKPGIERIFVVISTAASGTKPLNLEGVLDTCWSEGNAIPTGLGGNRQNDFLEALARRSATGGSLESIGVSNLWVKAARWQVVP